MGLRINTNIESLTAQRYLNKTQFNLQKTLERLSSGLRINQAADDAAGMAIAKNMEKVERGYAKAAENIQYATNYIQTAEGGLSTIADVLQRGRELIIQAANDTNTRSDREKIQLEITEIFKEIDRAATTTEFNGKPPLQIPPDRLRELTFVPGVVDIAFVIDGGGSIAPYVANIQANLTNFVNNLQSQGVSPRFSISRSATVSGAGIDNADSTTLLLDTTTNTAAVNAQLLAFPNVGGTSQDMFSALVETANNQVVGNEGVGGTDTPTRTQVNGQNAPMVIIMVTDHEPEQQVGAITGFVPTIGPGYSPAREAAVANFLAAQDNVTVFSVTEAAHFDKYDAIVAATGGQQLAVNLPTFGTALLGIADDIASLSLESPGKVIIDPEAIKVQIGPREGDLISVNRIHINTFFLGVEGIDVTDFSDLEKVSGDTAAKNAALTALEKDMLGKIDRALESVATQRSLFGAKQNRLEYAANNIAISAENIASARSRIEDADYAEETTALVRSQILAQAGTAVLSQANTHPDVVLQLLA